MDYGRVQSYTNRNVNPSSAPRLQMEFTITARKLITAPRGEDEQYQRKNTDAQHRKPYARQI